MNQKLFESLPGNARLTLKEVAELMGIGYAALTSRMHRYGVGKRCELFVIAHAGAGGSLQAEKIHIPKSNVQKFIKLMALIETKEKAVNHE